jgi:Bacterial Ig domain
MRKPRRFGIASALLVAVALPFLGASVAFGAIIQQEGYVTDTESGLDWRDAKLTRNMSYDDVLAQLDPGQPLEGWRYATQAEFDAFLNHVGVPYAGGECIPSYCDKYGTLEPPQIETAIALLGDTLLDFWESDPADAFDYYGVGATYGILAEPRTGINPRVARVWDSERWRVSNDTFVGDEEDEVTSNYLGFGFNGAPIYVFQADRIIGSLLVRVTSYVPPEICDNGIDDDADGLVDNDDPDCTPSHAGDFDGDGFPDDWELGNVDMFGLDIAALGADPCRKTIAVEIDYMDGSITGLSHKPHPDLIPAVAASFNAAPVPAMPGCPFAGFPTRASGINFIAYVDEEVPEQDGVFNAKNGLPELRDQYFDARLLPYLHYAVFAHALDTGDSTSGVCCNKGSFIVSLGYWPLANTTGPGRVPLYDPAGDQDEKLRKESGSFMHELGHALGLGHGGDENINYKPNYLSVMNYRFQIPLLTNADDPDTPILDYSREALPELDERQLYETDPLCDHPGCVPLMTAWKDPFGTRVSADITQPIDWNNRDGIEPDPVQMDLNENDTGNCVGDGPDDVLDTTPEGDDVADPPYITSGPDQTCDTTVAEGSDDSQLAQPGELPNIVYDGHDDWSNIRFLAAVNAYGAGVPEIEFDDHVDITAEEADEGDAFWKKVREKLLTGGENQPPTAEAGGPYAVTQGGSVTLDGSGSSDPDGDDLALEWDLDLDGSFGETGTGADNGDETGATPSYSPSAAGVPAPSLVNVSLRVCDPVGACDIGTADIQITSAEVEDQAPSITAIADQTVAEGASIVVPVSAGDPDPGDALTLSMVDASGLGVLTDNGDGTGSITFTAGPNDAGGPFAVTVRVTDTGGLFAETTFNLTATAQDQAPGEKHPHGRDGHDDREGHKAHSGHHDRGHRDAHKAHEGRDKGGDHDVHEAHKDQGDRDGHKADDGRDRGGDGHEAHDGHDDGGGRDGHGPDHHRDEGGLYGAR